MKKMKQVLRWVSPLLQSPDRDRVYDILIQHQPSLPYVIRWLEENRPLMNPKKWRILANIEELPRPLAYALVAYVVEPKRERINWPKKK